MQNNMHECEHKLIVKGIGKTRNDAFENIFATMRERLADEKIGYIVHAKPVSVQILKEEIEEYTERFMFLFWPRQKQNYKFEIEIKVLINYI